MGRARRGGRRELFEISMLTTSPPSTPPPHTHTHRFYLDKLFRNKTFGLQLFVPIESFPMHVSGIRPW